MHAHAFQRILIGFQWLTSHSTLVLHHTGTKQKRPEICKTHANVRAYSARLYYQLWNPKVTLQPQCLMTSTHVLASLLEHVADAGGADADKHLHELGSRSREERHTGFASDGLRQQRLAGACAAVAGRLNSRT